VAPSLEFALALECCRFAFMRGEARRPTPGADVDWALFLRLVRFHRIQGLAWHALADAKAGIPDQVARALADDAAEIAAANLRSAIECRGLLADFDGAEIPVLFLKGLTLGALAYGNASIKAAIDIDLLVAEDQCVQAARLLEGRGYELLYPRASAPPKRLSSWHRRHKESVWRRPAERLHLDLHTRLSDNRALLPSLGVRSPCQSVAVAAGVALPTLATDELFAYLCVHGASSAWFRLKWIADFAGFLHGQSGEELDRLYRRSQELGAGRAAAQALLLAHALFQSLERNSPLRESLELDRANRWLCNSALRQLAIGTEPSEPTEHILGTANIHLTQFALLPGLGFKLSELARQARLRG
jgi:Uncharacterised nucleotidyltransferase